MNKLSKDLLCLYPRTVACPYFHALISFATWTFLSPSPLFFDELPISHFPKSFSCNLSFANSLYLLPQNASTWYVQGLSRVTIFTSSRRERQLLRQSPFRLTVSNNLKNTVLSSIIAIFFDISLVCNTGAFLPNSMRPVRTGCVSKLVSSEFALTRGCYGV